MNLLDTYLSRSDFESYDDMKENLKVHIPDNFNFAFDVVDHIAALDPERQALLWCDDSGDDARFTFQDLKKLSDRAAAVFSDHGIRRGDPVMLVLKGRYEFWICLLALHKLGAVAIPATHMLTVKDYVYRVKRAGIRMIIALGEPSIVSNVDAAIRECGDVLEYRVMVGGSAPGWIDYNREMDSAPDSFTRPTGDQASCNSDTLFLYFTSGTTGMPKMVKHNYTYPLGHIVTARYWQNVQQGGLHFTVADSGWAKAMWGKIYGQWISGSSVFVYDYDVFNAKNMLKMIEKYRLTTFCAPPTVYRFLINEDLKAYDFSALKYCVVAGEPLNPEVYERFLEATGLKLMEGYGQTELTVTIATFPWMEPKPGSMGKPAPGYNIELINGEGEPCEIGEEGEIVVNTAKETPTGIFDGYYRDDEQTSGVWYDGYYHTGDMAWQDEDGYYWFIGRADDMIKSSGYRIGPFEVESALIEHPSVLECAITAVPDDVRGQVVKATVVLNKGYTGSDELVKELQEHVKHVTAPYKYPRIIEFVTELPKTISGKIRRVEIRSKDTSIAN